MKTLIIYYSYSGKTKQFAQNLADKEFPDADIMEIKDVRRPGKVKAYVRGCFAAIRGKSWQIESLDKDLSLYSKLILLFPIWAGNVPPAFNSLISQLPENNTIIIKAISASGKSDCKVRLESIMTAKNCTIESFEDIKISR